MIDDHQIGGIVARCVETMVSYHDRPRTRQSTLLMIGEVQTMVAESRELGLKFPEIVAHILVAVEVALMNRFGAELGVRLSTDFLKAFEGYGRFDELSLPGEPQPGGRGAPPR